MNIIISWKKYQKKWIEAVILKARLPSITIKIKSITDTYIYIPMLA